MQLRSLAIFTVLVCLSGCTERTLRIKTSPPGAEVIVDRRSYGPSPVDIPFVHGGMHEIILIGPITPDDPSAQAVKPVTIAYDTTRFAHDTPFIDLFVDLPLIRSTDMHEVEVSMPASDFKPRYESDPRTFRAELKARAGVLRDRAREAQWSAPPVATPESQPSSRPFNN